MIILQKIALKSDKKNFKFKIHPFVSKNVLFPWKVKKNMGKYMLIGKVLLVCCCSLFYYTVIRYISFQLLYGLF
jgi:hypothetical protein